MDLNKGTITSYEIVQGAKGKYTSLQIDGKPFKAFGKFHDAASKMKVGDVVSFAFEVNGKWQNLQALSLLHSREEVAAAPPSAGPPAWQLGMPESMFLSYVKDLMAARVDLTPTDAVTLMILTLDEVRSQVAARAARPTT